MKRCPQCQFIYPDSDDVCDFDQTTLIPAAESEIAAITNTPERPALTELAATHSRKFEILRNRRTLPIAAVLGLAVGVIFGVHFAVRRQMTPQPVQERTNDLTTPPIVANAPSPSPSPSIIESPSPEQTAATPEKAAPATPRISTAHSTTSTNPVATSEQGPDTGRKPVIILTGGAKVEADQVWRTKDGVWYRRDGVVTLLKRNRVKAIVNQ